LQGLFLLRQWFVVCPYVPKQLPYVNAERFSDFSEIRQRSVSLSAFQASDVIDLDVIGVKQLTIKMEANKYFGLYDSKGLLINPIIRFP